MKGPSLASRVREADSALSGRYDPINRIWIGDFPPPDVVNSAREVAKLGKALSDPDARATAARKILNAYPQTLNWDAEDRGMMIAIYATALEPACVSTIEEISHPATMPFGKYPPAAPDIVEAVEKMNRRVRSIEYRAKMITACREEIERPSPARPTDEERFRVQKVVGDFLSGVETHRTPEGEAFSKREKKIVAYTPKPLTDGQKEELASVRRRMAASDPSEKASA